MGHRFTLLHLLPGEVFRWAEQLVRSMAKIPQISCFTDQYVKNFTNSREKKVSRGETEAFDIIRTVNLLKIRTL
jgi:hypothetical protein